MQIVVVIDADLRASKDLHERVSGGRALVTAAISAAAACIEQVLGQRSGIRWLRRTGTSGDDFGYVIVGSTTDGANAAVAAVLGLLSAEIVEPIRLVSHYGPNATLGQAFRYRVFRSEIDPADLPASGDEIACLPRYDMTLGPVFGMSKDDLGRQYHLAFERDVRDDLDDEALCLLLDKRLLASLTVTVRERSRSFWLCFPVADVESAVQKQPGNLIAGAEEAASRALPLDRAPAGGHAAIVPAAVSQSIVQQLESVLRDALEAFADQPQVWVEPVLCDDESVANSPNLTAARGVSVSSIVCSDRSHVVLAPPHFGLTCLALRLALIAYRDHGEFWAYLDCREIRPNYSPTKAVRKACDHFGMAESALRCILVDSWDPGNQHLQKLLLGIIATFPDQKIVLLQTTGDAEFLTEQPATIAGRAFQRLRLLALPRSRIRPIVAAFAQTRPGTTEDALLVRLIDDLDTLNIHRTPHNCITLLTVATRGTFDSPVNRTRLLESVVSLLFDTESVPTYGAHVDARDCEHVMGVFAEHLIRRRRYDFSKDEFLTLTGAYCRDRLMHVDMPSVFDVLVTHHVIVPRFGEFEFRFAYWLFYFGAQRMKASAEFARFVLEPGRTMAYPEMLEFYAGIDRQRGDAVQALTATMISAANLVEQKVHLRQFDLYSTAKWQSTPEGAAKLREQIRTQVLESHLPNSLKDEHADAQYDQLRPFDQSIREVLAEFSVAHLLSQIRAACRVLRNSDYVDASAKRSLLDSIARGWDLLSRVVQLLAPAFARSTVVVFEGLRVVATDLTGTPEDRLRAVLFAIPQSIIANLRADIYSPKMGPLLVDQLDRQELPILRHEFALLIATCRPPGWKLAIENYVTSIGSHSFFLLDVLRALVAEYRFGFIDAASLAETGYLIRFCLAKNATGHKQPQLHDVMRVDLREKYKRSATDSDD